MMLNNNEIGILFIFIFIIYYIYNIKINNFIIKNVTSIIFLILLILIYLIIIKDYHIEDYLGYIGGLIAFGLGFTQFKISKEHEIISKYFDEKEKDDSLNSIIQSYKVLYPLLSNTKNLEIIIQNKISKIIDSVETIDNFKSKLNDEVFDIFKNIGDKKSFIYILLKMKNRNIIEINKLREINDIKKIENKNTIIQIIVDVLESAYLRTYRKECTLEKIINTIKTFFKP